MNKQPESFEEKNQEYFDEKKYRTIIVGKDGFKGNDEIQDAINALGDDEIMAEEREELLKHLKASNPLPLILEAITKAKSHEIKSRLISVCWEIDLNCSDHILFFAELACSDDFNVALEALTVIDNIEFISDNTVLKNAEKIVNEKIKMKPVTSELLMDLKKIISAKMK